MILKIFKREPKLPNNVPIQARRIDMSKVIYRVLQRHLHLRGYSSPWLQEGTGQSSHLFSGSNVQHLKYVQTFRQLHINGNMLKSLTGIVSLSWWSLPRHCVIIRITTVVSLQTQQGVLVRFVRNSRRPFLEVQCKKLRPINRSYLTSPA